MQRPPSLTACTAAVGLLLSIAALTVAFTGCYTATRKTLLAYIRPDVAFDAQTPLPPPDYTTDTAWAALPSRTDNADLVPDALVRDGQADASVDCFFIHGTTYADDASWNQPVDAAETNRITDETVLPSQASAFNGSCRVFVPRYRQATLYAFADSSPNASQAKDLAYTDIRQAFAHFVEHENLVRPFIIAGHSQGSMHGLRLLKEQISATHLAARLVAAYLPGWNITQEDVARMTDIPVCNSPLQTGCLAAWNSEGPDARPGPVDLTGETTVCVNPLTWTTDGSYASPDLNPGAWHMIAGQDDPPPKPLPGLVDARCRQGALVVTEPKNKRFRNNFVLDALLGRDVCHNFDYAYFYMSIRQNVEARVTAFLAAER